MLSLFVQSKVGHFQHLLFLILNFGFCEVVLLYQYLVLYNQYQPFFEHISYKCETSFTIQNLFIKYYCTSFMILYIFYNQDCCILQLSLPMHVKVCNSVIEINFLLQVKQEIQLFLPQKSRYKIGTINRVSQLQLFRTKSKYFQISPYCTQGNRKQRAKT